MGETNSWSTIVPFVTSPNCILLLWVTRRDEESALQLSRDALTLWACFVLQGDGFDLKIGFAELMVQLAEVMCFGRIEYLFKLLGRQLIEYLTCPLHHGLGNASQACCLMP